MELHATCACASLVFPGGIRSFQCSKRHWGRKRKGEASYVPRSTGGMSGVSRSCPQHFRWASEALHTSQEYWGLKDFASPRNTGGASLKVKLPMPMQVGLHGCAPSTFEGYQRNLTHVPGVRGARMNELEASIVNAINQGAH